MLVFSVRAPFLRSSCGTVLSVTSVFILGHAACWCSDVVVGSMDRHICMIAYTTYSTDARVRREAETVATKLQKEEQFKPWVTR